MGPFERLVESVGAQPPRLRNESDKKLWAWMAEKVFSGGAMRYGPFTIPQVRVEAGIGSPPGTGDPTDSIQYLEKKGFLKVTELLHGKFPTEFEIRQDIPGL